MYNAWIFLEYTAATCKAFIFCWAFSFLSSHTFFCGGCAPGDVLFLEMPSFLLQCAVRCDNIKFFFAVWFRNWSHPRRIAFDFYWQKDKLKDARPPTKHQNQKSKAGSSLFSLFAWKCNRDLPIPSCLIHFLFVQIEIKSLEYLLEDFQNPDLARKHYDDLKSTVSHEQALEHLSSTHHQRNGEGKRIIYSTDSRIDPEIGDALLQDVFNAYISASESEHGVMISESPLAKLITYTRIREATSCRQECAHEFLTLLSQKCPRKLGFFNKTFNKTEDYCAGTDTLANTFEKMDIITVLSGQEEDCLQDLVPK